MRVNQAGSVGCREHSAKSKIAVVARLVFAFNGPSFEVPGLPARPTLGAHKASFKNQRLCVRPSRRQKHKKER
eukprot:363789-Chlamydomonas_euryale.AAC.4